MMQTRSIPLSVVIPALNEAAIITETLARLQPLREEGAELLLVDGGSSDETQQLADPLVDELITSPPGRALQMNQGWKAARGELLWFLHADSRADEDHWRALPARAGDVEVWGWFDIQFDSRKWIFKTIAGFVNRRSRIIRVATGDQGLFISRGLLEAIGGFPEIPLMEDVAICRRLKGIAPAHALGPPLTTSSRRWERHGVLRTMLLMWYLRAAFFLGADPQRLARRYRDAR